MSLLYTEETKRILYTTKAPHRGLLIDVIEYEDKLALRIYRDNFEMFSDPQKLDFKDWIDKVMLKIRGTNIPCVLEVEDYAPKR